MVKIFRISKKIGCLKKYKANVHVIVSDIPIIISCKILLKLTRTVYLRPIASSKQQAATPNDLNCAINDWIIVYFKYSDIK